MCWKKLSEKKEKDVERKGSEEGRSGDDKILEFQNPGQLDRFTGASCEKRGRTGGVLLTPQSIKRRKEAAAASDESEEKNIKSYINEKRTLLSVGLSKKAGMQDVFLEKSFMLKGV